MTETGPSPVLGRLSLRWLLVLLVAAVLLPALGLSAWFLSSQVEQARRAAESEVTQLAQATRALLELTLGDQRAILQRLASRPRVRALDAADFDPGVAEYLRVHPEYNNLGVRARDARLVFSGHPGPAQDAERVREFPWFKEGLARGSFMASDAYKGNLSGRWVTVLTQPVLGPEGEVAGLVNLSQDLLTLNRRVLGAVPPTAVVAVIDRQRRFLLRSADPEFWIGQSGSSANAWQVARGRSDGLVTTTGADGVTRVYAFVTMPDTGWRIVAGVPAAQVFAEPKRLLERSLVLAAAILLLSLLAAWRFGRGITTPIAAIAKAAAGLAGGDASARAPLGGPAELREVAREFNQMAQSLTGAQEALRDSETSLAITLQSIGDAVIATDLQGRVTRMNPTAERLCGWTAQEAQGRLLGEVFRIVHAETRAPALDPVQQVLASGQVVGLANHTALIARGGAEHQIADSAAPIRDAAGQTVGVVLVFSDVSERYRIEQELHASTEVLRQRDRALAEISQGVMMIDAQGRITYVNPGFERLTGYAASEVLGRTSLFLQGPDTSVDVLAEMRSRLLAGLDFHGEILNYRKDGTPMWLALDISPLRDEQGVLIGFVGAQRDITDRRLSEQARRELEVQLRASQKMESIGTLAGGIAHDFNNILGAILGNLALVRDGLDASPAVVQALDQMQRASLRARGLVQQILAFSRRQVQVLAVQPLAPIVEETLAMLRSTLPATVELRLAIGRPDLHVDTDATQMQQVLMNLCTNAWHALGGRAGSIEIGLDERVLDAAAGQAAGGLLPGRYAHLWVRDDGAGMDDATRERMFEPFFTTKPVGDGTGLGLSVVHGIVTSHRGGIVVHSLPGQGTTVDIYFPSREAAAPGRDTAAPVADPAPGRGQRVLYVDDDEAVSFVAERLLQRAGLRVDVVATVEQALSAVAAAEPPYEIVVTDFHMPGASGLDLLAELSRRWPDLGVILTSGYVSDALRDGATALGVRQILQKEDLFEQLVPAVLRALEARAGG